MDSVRDFVAGWIRLNFPNATNPPNGIIESIADFAHFVIADLDIGMSILCKFLKCQNNKMTNLLPEILNRLCQIIHEDDEIARNIIKNNILECLVPFCTPATPFIVLYEIYRILRILQDNATLYTNKNYITHILKMYSVLIMYNNQNMIQGAIYGYYRLFGYASKSEIYSVSDILKFTPHSNEFKQKLKNDQKIFDESMKSELQDINTSIPKEIMMEIEAYYGGNYLNESCTCLVQRFIFILLNWFNNINITEQYGGKLSVICCCGSAIMENDEIFRKYYKDFLIISKECFDKYGETFINDLSGGFNNVLDVIKYISFNEINYELMMPWIDSLMSVIKHNPDNYNSNTICILNGNNIIRNHIIKRNFIAIFFNWIKDTVPVLENVDFFEQSGHIFYEIVRNILSLKKYDIYKQVKNESNCLIEYGKNSSIPPENQMFVTKLMNIIATKF